MEINNNGSVKNQQNVGEGSTGIMNVGGKRDISKEERIEKIKDYIMENCTQQEQDALLPVISELCGSINEDREDAKKSEVWINKIERAVAALGSAASITNAAWWPGLIACVENLIRSL